MLPQGMPQRRHGCFIRGQGRHRCFLWGRGGQTNVLPEYESLRSVCLYRLLHQGFSTLTLLKLPVYNIVILMTLLDEVHVFKGLVHPKMKIKSLITHPHAVPTS